MEKVLLVVGGGCLVIGLVCLGIVTYNAGSRTLVLALTAAAGALLIYALNALFELKEVAERPVFISAEATADLSQPSISQWRYDANSEHFGIRPSVELEASSWLAQNDPDRFRQDRQGLVRDFVVYSLVNYVRTVDVDWQLEWVVLHSPTIGGTVSGPRRVSNPSECTTVDSSELKRIFEQGGNVFAGAFSNVGGSPICLPPDTTLTVERTQVVFENPFSRVSFTMNNTPRARLEQDPGRLNADIPRLEDGTPRFYTEAIQVEARVIHSRWRSQNGKAATYRAWTQHLVNGVQSWFQGSASPNYVAVAQPRERQ